MNLRGQTTALGLSVLAGIWLIVAPFILSYFSSAPTTNDIWVGVIVGILALIRIFAPRGTTWLSWVNVLAGIWLIVAPFVLGYAYQTPRYNDILLGIVVAILGIWSAGAALAGSAKQEYQT